MAAHHWMGKQDLTGLQTAPKIKLLPVHGARDPYPLSWDEQTLLFNQLPQHLKQMAIFKVNSGWRDQEVYQLNRI